MTTSELNPGAALRRCPSSCLPAAAPGRIVVASSSGYQRTQLRTALESEGHHVAEAETADQIRQAARLGYHDVLIVDSAIDRTGLYELCRAIRTKSDLGIIVVSRENTRQSRIDALNAGADDYVPAPYILAEFLARVRAILRRVARSRENEIVLEDRAIDLKSHKVKGPGGCSSHLTPKEFLVLEHLVSNANRPLTNQRLAQSIWHRDGMGEVEYVRVVIRQLRRKLEPDPDNPRYILTERSVGYRFCMPPAGAEKVETGTPNFFNELSLAG